MIVDIEDFGGVGNDSTDNATAFTNAMAQLVAAGGGMLRLGAGTYRTSSGVTLHSEITLQGAGQNVSRIRDTRSSGNTINWTAPLSRTRVSDLEIGATGIHSGWAFNGAFPCGALEIERVLTDGNHANGFNLYGGAGMRMQDVRVLGSGGGIGVLVGDGLSATPASVVVLDQIYVMGNFQTGMKCDNVSHAAIREPVIEYCTNGIEATGGANNVAVSNPYFEEVINTYSIDNATIITDGAMSGGSFSGSGRSYSRTRQVLLEARPTADTTSLASGDQVPLGTVVQRESSADDIIISNNDVVIKEPGTYAIDVPLVVQTSSSSVQYLNIIKVNGTEVARGAETRQGNGDETVRATFRGYFAKNDSIAVFLNQNSGGNVKITDRSRVWVQKT